MLGFGVCDSVRKLVDDHSFFSRLTTAPMQRLDLHLSARQQESFGHLYTSFASKITGIYKVKAYRD